VEPTDELGRVGNHFYMTHGLHAQLSLCHQHP
jgi:hypothetical protein